MTIDSTPGTKDYYLKSQKVIDEYLKDVFSIKDKANHYSKDGVINPDVYFQKDRARICFVLKENHSFDRDKGDVLWYPVADDVLFHHVDNTNRYWATNIIRVERFIHHGMHTDCASIPKYSSKAEALSAGDYCTGIGYINIKKYDNNSKNSIPKDIDSFVFKENIPKEITNKIDRKIRSVNSEALRIQLKALMPDYIIACDSSWDRSQKEYCMYNRLEYLLQYLGDFRMIHEGSDKLFYVVSIGERKMVIINWFHPSYRFSGDGTNYKNTKWAFQTQHEKLEKLKTELNELVMSGVLGSIFSIP